MLGSHQPTLTQILKKFSAARLTEILNQILKNPGSSQAAGPMLSTERAPWLPRGAGQDARGGDPEDNRAAMAASGTS